MGDIKKSSVIKEALVEFNEIQEAAVANAKDILAKQFPKNYSELLKEELNKNKKAKESYKKLDEAEDKESEISDENESNKESDMKNQTKETKKVVKEGDENQPFKETPKKVAVVEEREKDFMGDIEKDTPNIHTPLPEDGDTYTEKITTKKETIANKTSIKEEFDMSGLDANSVGSAIEESDDEDEIITMDEIVSEMKGIDEELSDMSGLPRPELQKRGTPENQGGDAFDQLVKMREQLDEMISGMGVAEQKNHGGQGANKVNAGGPTQSMIDEEGEITDDDVIAVLGGEGGAAPMDEQEVEENIQHTQTHSNARQVGANDNTNYGKADRLRSAMKNEGEVKKISSLINENKGLTKKLNETKKFKKSVTELVEQYKNALDKYRNQLKEMATFNTNLAHVNNLLVNESLALTQEDKIKIINEFKKVDTIAESQEKYKSFLTEMKSSKPTLTETIEKKVSASVAPSSKKLDEAKEVTAYENDEHIQKMRKLIETIEGRRGKKII